MKKEQPPNPFWVKQFEIKGFKKDSMKEDNCPQCGEEMSEAFGSHRLFCQKCNPDSYAVTTQPSRPLHSDPAGEEDTIEDIADKFVYHTEITDPKECFLGGYRYAQETLPFASIIEGLSIDELRIAYQEFRKLGSGTKRTNFEAFTAGYKLKPPTPQTGREELIKFANWIYATDYSDLGLMDGTKLVDVYLKVKDK